MHDLSAANDKIRIRNEALTRALDGGQNDLRIKPASTDKFADCPGNALGILFQEIGGTCMGCLLYTSPSPRDS